MQSIVKQTQAEKAKVSSWRSQQRRATEEEAQQIDAELKQQVSGVEKSAEQAKEAVRKEKAAIEKRRVLKGGKVSTKAQEATIKAIEKQRKEAVAEGQSARGKVAKTKAEILAEIETATVSTMAEIEKASQESKAEYKRLIKTNVELDTGEFVGKENYNKLSEDDQKLIKKVGLTDFNKAKDKEFKDTNIKTGKDEYVSKEFYDSLTKEEQEYLNSHSLSQFNRKMQSKWEGEHAQLRNGEYVKRSFFNSLPPEAQKVLYEQGIDAFNKWATKKQVDFKADYIKVGKQTGKDEYILRDYYKLLSDDNKVYVLRYGTDAFNKKLDKEQKEFEDNHKQLANGTDWVDKDWYGSLSPDAKASCTSIENYNNWIDDNYEKASNYDPLTGTSGTVYIPKKGSYDAQGNYTPGFNDLTPDHQRLIESIGLTWANQVMKSQYDANYIQLDSGDTMSRLAYDKLDKADQKLINKEGIAGFNAIQQKEVDDYVATLPEEAQAMVAQYGLSVLNVENLADKDKFNRYKSLGLIPADAEFVGVNKAGEIEFTQPPQPIDLDNLDIESATVDNWGAIAKAAYDDPRYHEGGTYGGFGSYINGLVASYNNLVAVQASTNDKEALDKLSTEAFGKLLKGVPIEALSLLFPPARALHADTTLKDIRGVEWVIGGANVGLLFVAPVLGMAGKAAGVIGKVAAIGSKAITYGAALTFPIITAIEWENMSDTERNINVAIDALFIAAVFGKPLLKTIKTILSSLKKTDAALAAKYIKLSNAIVEGSATKIKNAATELAEYGSSIKAKNPIEAGKMINQGKFFKENARLISRNRLNILGTKLTPELEKVYKELHTLVSESKMRRSVDIRALEKPEIKIEVRSKPKAISKIRNIIIRNKKIRTELGIKITKGNVIAPGYATEALSQYSAQLHKSIGSLIQTNGYSAALKTYGKDLLLAYSSKALQYAKSELKMATSRLPWSVATEAKGKQIQKDLFREVLENGGIPYDAPSNFRLKNGMTIEQAIREISNLENPILEVMYGGSTIKITPRGNIAKLKLNYPLFTSPSFFNRIIDFQKGLIRGYGEDFPSVWRAFTKEGKRWNIKANNPVKNILKEIKSSVINIDEVGHRISLTPQQVSQYNDLFVEIGVPARWASPMPAGVPQLQIIPVNGTSLRSIAANLYKAVITRVESAGFVSALKLFGEGIVKGVYPNAIEMAIMEDTEGDSLTGGDNQYTIPNNITPSGGSSSVMTLAGSIVNAVEAISKTNTIWKADSSPSALLTNRGIVAIPQNIGAIPASYVSTGAAIKATAKIKNQYDMKFNYSKLSLQNEITKANESAFVKNIVSEQVKNLTGYAITVANAASTEVDNINELNEIVKENIINKADQFIENIQDNQVKIKVNIQIAEKIDEITKVAIENINLIKIEKFVPPPPPPPTPIPPEKKKKLTAEELAGAVAWKQGFIYIMIYPPYDKLHYSRKPYKGVKIVKGVRSAYDTIVKLGKRIPANLEYDMGIMDVFIGTPAKGKPELKFRRDVKQKTKHSGLKVAKL